MISQIISALQTKQRLGIAGRQQSLAEQRFESEQLTTKTNRDAINSLADVKIENIDQVSAKTLLTINKGSLSTILQMNAALKAGQTPTTPTPVREEKLLAAMRKQVGEGGDIADSDIWRVMTTGKNKEKTQKELRTDFVKIAARNPVFATQDAKGKKEFIDNLVDLTLQEPGSRIKELGKEATLEDKTIEEFNRAKRSEAIDSLFQSAHN